MNDNDDATQASGTQTSASASSASGGDAGTQTATTVDAHAGHETLARVRDLILTAFTDVVPELVGGDTVDDLVASVDLARKAYAAVADRAKDERSASVHVPAGGGSRVPSVNLEELSPAAKIAEGLRQRNARK